MQRKAEIADLGRYRAALWWKIPESSMRSPVHCYSTSQRVFPVSQVDCIKVISLPASVIAVYKQWIPNTNFETASNWDAGRVPCARDLVQFWKNKVFDFLFS